MFEWQFRQELELVHTVQALARHLERFLNAGYAVCRQPNGVLVLLPDTVVLQPFQTFTLELLAGDHHGKYFRVKSKDLDAACDIYDCSLFRGSVKRKLGSLIVIGMGWFNPSSLIYGGRPMRRSARLMVKDSNSRRDSAQGRLVTHFYIHEITCQASMAVTMRWSQRKALPG